MIDIEWKKREVKRRFRRWLTDKMIEWDVHRAELIKKRGDLVMELHFTEVEEHYRNECFCYVYEYEGQYCSVIAYTVDGGSSPRGEVACRVWDDPIEEFIPLTFFEYEHILKIYDDDLRAEIMAQRI